MHKIHKTLDRLADLYLTGPVDESEKRPPAASAPRLAQDNSPSPAATNRLRLVNADIALDEYHLEEQLAQSLDGPVPLEVRCPHEWRVRMMVDRSGRIHLWRGQVDHDLHAGIVSLINARFWVRENIPIIALLQPECHFEADAEPMLHVFTTDSAKGSALAGGLGPFVKINVLHGRSAPAQPEYRHRRQPA